MKKTIKGKIIFDGKVFKIWNGKKMQDIREVLMPFTGREVELIIGSPDPKTVEVFRTLGRATGTKYRMKEE